jgi:hypothetical protein
VSQSDDRARALHTAKLRGLLRGRVGHEVPVDSVDAFDDGAAVVVDGHAWCYRSGSAGLGSAVVWATRRDAIDVSVLLDDDAGVAARQAEALEPSPSVYTIVGADLMPAVAAPLPEVESLPEGAEDFVPTLVAAGCEPVVEHGCLRAEVHGLEVARLVSGEGVWGNDADAGGALHLEVGVGRFDREAASMMLRHLSAGDALAEVVATVADTRRPGSHHPLARLARERWLRHAVVVRPDLVELAELAAVEPVVERHGLRQRLPAPAVGVDAEDRRVLVVCSVGIDPELVAHTADLVLRHRPDRVVAVVPERDRLPVLDAVVARLAVPVAVRGVVPPWSEPAATT